jgi:hypothetical protein
VASLDRATKAGTRLPEGTFEFVSFHVGEDEVLRVILALERSCTMS